PSRAAGTSPSATPRGAGARSPEARPTARSARASPPLADPRPAPPPPRRAAREGKTRGLGEVGAYVEYELRITNCGLRITNCGLRITDIHYTTSRFTAAAARIVS